VTTLIFFTLTRKNISSNLPSNEKSGAPQVNLKTLDGVFMRVDSTGRRMLRRRIIRVKNAPVEKNLPPGKNQAKNFPAKSLLVKSLQAKNFPPSRQINCSEKLSAGELAGKVFSW
jgi:hypothetical protein